VETLEPCKLESENSVNFDSEFIYKDYVQKERNGNFSVFLHISNIHCSACVWLNEKVLSNTKGIKSVHINFSTSRASIEWDDSQIKLSKIIEIIHSIGYKANLYTSDQIEIQTDSQAKDLLKRMLVSAFSFMSIMSFSMYLFSGFFSGIELEYKQLFHYLIWLLATPSFIYSGVPFYKSAFYGLKNKTLNMDSLIVTGISIAYFYSIYVTITNSGEVYFDTVSMIYFFILTGKFMEAKARSYANQKITNLLAKLPEVCTVQRENKEIEILSKDLVIGDILLIKAGDRIPVDAELLSDKAYIDESFLTGESNSITKLKNQKLLAGSISINQFLKAKVISTKANSTLSILQNLIENSFLSKANVQIKTDKLAFYFILFTIFISILCFSLWFLNSGNLEKSLIYTVSVLIVACPCALGLSIPTTLVVANLLYTKEGMLLKKMDTIEELEKIDIIAFDKTGTLTENSLNIIDFTFKNPELIIPFIYLIEKKSTHPIAKTIYKFLETKFSDQLQTINTIELKKLNEISGSGILAEIDYNHKKYSLKIGKKEFVENIQSTEIESSSRIYFSINETLEGFFVLEDKMRPEVLKQIESLKSMGQKIIILSGDKESSVTKIANELNLDEYYFNLKPEEKLKLVTELQNKNHRVMMIGDGINDSAVLAKANVGISLELASELAIDKSDIILMKNDLSNFRKIIFFAKQTKKTIIQNLSLSILYNSVMLPIAAFGYMEPIYCSLFMTISSLTVLVNSYLLNFRVRSLR
jgi:Cu+-exporting ATPase